MRDDETPTSQSRPGPFKVFRPLRLAVPKGVKDEVRWRYDSRGVYGIELLLGDQPCIDFDFSDWITDTGAIRYPSPTSEILPVKVDESRVGLRGIRTASMIAAWYDERFTPELVIEGWRRHGSLIPFEEIVPHLICRDVILMHDYRYTCMFPSWDVCLTLPAYLYQCEDIPGFEARLQYTNELGDQIRKSLEGFSGKVGEVEHGDLEPFLEKLHSLEDELSLALGISRAGFDVRFGDRGGPDLFVNSIPCEQKSRFPAISEGEVDVEVKVPEGYTILDVYRLIMLEVKQAERALRRADIFFCNLSRTGPGMAYTDAVDRERAKPRSLSQAIASLNVDSRLMVHLALEFQKEWGKTIAPYTRFSGPNPRYMMPIPVPLAKYQEVLEIENRKRGGGLTKETGRKEEP